MKFEKTKKMWGVKFTMTLHHIGVYNEIGIEYMSNTLFNDDDDDDTFREKKIIIVLWQESLLKNKTVCGTIYLSMAAVD